jgi:hypothetical protein
MQITPFKPRSRFSGPARANNGHNPVCPPWAVLSYHNRKQRWACVAAHRRCGKTVACINDLIKGALTCTKPNARFAYIAPLFTQAKDVAWTYLKHFTATIPGVETNESELRVDLPNGARIRLYGADNYDRMRGIYLDGVVLDEYADMDPRAWAEVIRPLYPTAKAGQRSSARQRAGTLSSRSCTAGKPSTARSMTRIGSR